MLLISWLLIIQNPCRFDKIGVVWRWLIICLLLSQHVICLHIFEFYWLKAGKQTGLTFVHTPWWVKHLWLVDYWQALMRSIVYHTFQAGKMSRLQKKIVIDWATEHWQLLMSVFVFWGKCQSFGNSDVHVQPTVWSRITQLKCVVDVSQQLQPSCSTYYKLWIATIPHSEVLHNLDYSLNFLEDMVGGKTLVLPSSYSSDILSYDWQ